MVDSRKIKTKKYFSVCQKVRIQPGSQGKENQEMYWTADMAQVAEHPPSKYEVLSSNSSIKARYGGTYL
jgi:hypothetical protein